MCTSGRLSSALTARPPDFQDEFGHSECQKRHLQNSRIPSKILGVTKWQMLFQNPVTQRRLPGKEQRGLTNWFQRFLRNCTAQSAPRWCRKDLMQLFRRQDLARNSSPDAPSSTAWQLLDRFIERRVQGACESLMWAGSIGAERLTQQGVALTTGALAVALPHKAASIGCGGRRHTRRRHSRWLRRSRDRLPSQTGARQSCLRLWSRLSRRMRSN